MIFDTKTVAALVCALADEDSNVRAEVVVFFIAAVAQGKFHWFFLGYSYRDVCRGLPGQDI